LRPVLNFVCGHAEYSAQRRFRSFIFGLTCIWGEFYPGSLKNSGTGQNPPLVPTQQQCTEPNTGILRKIIEIEASSVGVQQLGSNRPSVSWSRGHFQPKLNDGIVPNHD
jgi:hypothetical protein